MTLRAVLAAQGSLKGRGMAQNLCLALFASPALARTALVDLLTHAQTLNDDVRAAFVPYGKRGF